MNGLAPLCGHEDVRAGLARAFRDHELPGSLLLHGPTGVGKQRLALWLAQLLLCEHPGDEPCGTCTPCRLVLRLEHPDLLWFFPIPRPKGGGSPEKLADAMEETRGEELAARREQPLRPVAPGELVGLYIQQMQTLRRYAASRPATGPRKVFIVGDAELLVVQEASPEAANAILKVLEEPPRDTTFILTSADPEALLPTIRSRLLPIRLRPLDPDRAAEFLTAQLGTPPDLARRTARLAQGAIGRALGFLPRDGELAPLEKLRQDARALLDAAAAPDANPRFAAALHVAPAGARGGFSDLLEFLAGWLRDLVAVAAGAPELVVNADALDDLRRLAVRFPDAAARGPLLLRRVDDALTLAYGNVNPQLILGRLLRELAQLLNPQADTPIR